MKKVLDKALEAKIKAIISESETPEADIISLFKELQDASGLKVCKAVTEGDVALRKVE